jgi:hypothetical protein
MPNVKEIEKALLGSLIMCPNLLECADISDQDFTDPLARKIFGLIAETWEHERPAEIDVTILCSRLNNDGAGTYISSLLTGAVKDDVLSFKRRLSELRKTKLLSNILSEIYQQAKSGELNLESILPKIEVYKNLKSIENISLALKSGAELAQVDLKVEWALERLIPERAITITSAPGGTGKTFLFLQIAKAISTGEPIFGLHTKKLNCVYVDYENPLPLIIERIKKLGAEFVFFWTLASEPKPPLLDSDAWELFFNLPPDSLIVFDSLRSSHAGDENSSQDMSRILYRLKLLREKGFTISVLHHSPKGKDEIYKGSTAISDLADQTLQLYVVNKAKEDVDLSTVGTDALFYFGTGQKSRYERHSIFLRFNGTAFELAEHPDEEKLRAIHHFLLQGGPKQQKEVREFIASEFDISKPSVALRLLKRGEGRYWHSVQEARNKPMIYYPIAGKARETQGVF